MSYDHNAEVVARGGGSWQARYCMGYYDDMFCELEGDCEEQEEEDGEFSRRKNQRRI